MCGMTNTSAPLDLPEHLFLCIDHVGVAVPDLDEAIAFYTETYGMTVAHEETNEEQGVREAMVAVGDTGSHIQLLAPLDRLRRSGAADADVPVRRALLEELATVMLKITGYVMMAAPLAVSTRTDSGKNDRYDRSKAMRSVTSWPKNAPRWPLSGLA